MQIWKIRSRTETRQRGSRTRKGPTSTRSWLPVTSTLSVCSTPTKRTPTPSGATWWMLAAKISAGQLLFSKNFFAHLSSTLCTLAVVIFYLCLSLNWWTFFKKRKRRQNRVGLYFRRLDYFVVSDKLKHKICESTIHSNVMGSDHCPISLKMAL